MYVLFNSIKRNPWPSSFEKGKINVLIHIRQGDTAVICTPTGTYVPVFGSKRFQDVDSLGNSKCKVTHVADYYTFLKELLRNIYPQPDSVIICADGYHRTLDLIKKHKHALRLKSTNFNALAQYRTKLEEV